MGLAFGKMDSPPLSRYPIREQTRRFNEHFLVLAKIVVVTCCDNREFTMYDAPARRRAGKTKKYVLRDKGMNNLCHHRFTQRRCHSYDTSN